jgi:hypothetical protein
MNQTTQLASGLINGHDRLTVELVEPPDMPAAVLIRWPARPSITTPDAYSNVAAACMHPVGGGYRVGRNQDTEEALTHRQSTRRAPGEILRGSLFPLTEQALCRTSGHRSPLRDLIPRS